MTTPAEKQLVDTVAAFLEQRDGSSKLLNLGAGKSVVLENKLAERGCSFTCDRLDMDDCAVNHPNVQNCYQCSAEQMAPLASESYDLVFSNYVLEHIANLDAAAAEIRRVLKPNGALIASVPNPQSPEFTIARFTPFWFHRLVRGGTGWHTEYAFGSIRALSAIFSRAGMETVCVTHYPLIAQYFERLGPLRWLAAGYDALVRLSRCKRFMGNVCFVARRAS
jgi:ubiquinone/menaquinone biosynthesis C-methylase UbiE